MSTPNVHLSGRKAAPKRAGARQTTQASAIAVKPNSSATHDSAIVNGEQREAMIREAAYFRSESRGFCPGYEIEDWLAAETQIDHRLANVEAPQYGAHGRNG